MEPLTHAVSRPVLAARFRERAVFGDRDARDWKVEPCLRCRAAALLQPACLAVGMSDNEDLVSCERAQRICDCLYRVRVAHASLDILGGGGVCRLDRERRRFGTGDREQFVLSGSFGEGGSDRRCGARRYVTVAPRGRDAGAWSAVERPAPDRSIPRVSHRPGGGRPRAAARDRALRRWRSSRRCG